VASVWRCRFAADSSRLASEAAGKMSEIEILRKLTKRAMPFVLRAGNI
jgi:hypothetical protein